MPDPGNLTRFQELLISWILKNTPAMWLEQYNSLLHCTSYLYTHEVQLPSLINEASLCIKWRPAQKTILDTVQRSPHQGSPRLSEYTRIHTSLHLWLREHHRQKGLERWLRARTPGRLLLNSLSQKWLHNKTGLVTWKGINTLGPQLYIKNYRELVTIGRRRISLSQG